MVEILNFCTSSGEECKRKQKLSSFPEGRAFEVFPSTLSHSLSFCQLFLTDLLSKSSTRYYLYQSHTTTTLFLITLGLAWTGSREKLVGEAEAVFSAAGWRRTGGKLDGRKITRKIRVTGGRWYVAFSSRARAAQTTRRHLGDLFASTVSVSLSLSLDTI